jgi:hypothetical protein
MVIYLLILILLLTYSNKKHHNDISAIICGFFLIKWITDYRKCTISYIECKIRNIKKEEGIIYNILEPIFDINKDKDRYYYYILFSIIIINNII